MSFILGVLGVLLVVLGIIFTGGAIRAWPPGTMRPNYLHPTSWREITLGLVEGIICFAFAARLLL